MRPARQLAFVLLIFGILATAMLGCGQNPVAPNTGQETSTAAGMSRTAEPEGLLSLTGSVVNSLVGLIVKTLDLIGSLGGSLTNGRWTVVIPAGAVEGAAKIALGVSNSTSSECQLEIWPADQNHFQVPATLTADCRSVSSDRLKSYVIYWYNPSTRTWVQVEGSRVDLVSKTVSAPLTHFSRYAVGPSEGKAGW